MRWAIFTLGVLACIGAAFAQNAPADGRFVAQWEPRQDNKFIREYPREALDPGLAGAVELCCAAYGPHHRLPNRL